MSNRNPINCQKSKEIIYSGSPTRKMTLKLLVALREVQRIIPKMSKEVDRVYFIQDWDINSISHAIGSEGVLLPDADAIKIIKKLDTIYGLYAMPTRAIIVRADKDRNVVQLGGTIARYTAYAYKCSIGERESEKAAKETEALVIDEIVKRGLV